MSDDIRAHGRVDARCWAGQTFASVYDTKRNNFDCIRFVLASLVIWSHNFPLAGHPVDLCYALSGQIDGGSLAVDGFFIVSGFLVAQSWVSCPNVMIFARKRALRIVPALLAALAFGALIIGPLNTTVSARAYFLSGEPWRHFVGVVLNRYLYLPTVFSTNPIPGWTNSPLWSLRYEILCYVGVGLLGLNRSKNWRGSIIGVFLLSWAYLLVSNYIVVESSVSIPQVTARLVACFSAGMLFYFFRARVPYRRGLAVAAGLIVLVTFLTTGFRAAFPVAGGYLLLYLAFSPAIPLSRFGRYGDFSYGLYVFAFPIEQTIVRVVGPDIPLPLFFCLSLVATLAVAYGSWHLIEAPALSFKPRPTRDVVATRSKIAPATERAAVRPVRIAGGMS